MEVAEVLPAFADAFAFEEFNRMQRETLPALLESDENVVASAPTASGKTALAELAICKALDDGGTALFIAPLRALTNEKEDDWDRFEELDYSVYVVTGERELNSRRARHADILVMTPEKLDSATRKHDSRRYDFVTDIDVCVIDEVHLLDADRRGSVLEVTISRLRRLCDPRVVALSATMPNVDDVAAWLDAPEETTFEFGEQYRPVDLNAGVKTYTHGENSFADKYRRLYRALDLAEPHLREDGQALVFVSSRQDTVRAAEAARDEIAGRDIPMGARGDYDFHTESKELENDTLRNSVLDGVAFHHAGLSKNDRDLVEEWFKEGHVELLFSTSTLAWGVNLPARCVVIRDTKLHDPLEGEVDMSPLDVLQMLGRAGRPGYDDVGYGWVVCDTAEADKYRRLLNEGKEIESRLAESLETHLNAEIAMGTITDLEDVMDWLETTFYYERGQSKPEAYDFPNLKGRVRDCLEDLVARGFVETGEAGDLSIEATPRGVLASKYYLRLETAASFAGLCDRTESGRALETGDVLAAVAGATEFESVSARQDERDAVDAVLVGQEAEDLEPGQRKVLAILRSAASGTTPAELQSDAWVIRRNATRLLSALGAFLDRFVGPHAANLSSRAEARAENGVAEDAVGLTAIDGVASGRASKLAKEGLSTPGDVLEAGIDGLADAGLSEGVAERVYEGAQSLPSIEMEWGQFPETIAAGENAVHEVTVRNVGEPARAGITVTVNGREMTSTNSYLRDVDTVPVGVFGADAEELEYTVSVAFPEESLLPVERSRTVDIR
ncbi:DEAD/DEAH box helicase [Natronobacterium gregoryi]|uniref:DEAD/DEAH box helicase n=2 Tax=Natronobacterium gregoryi TaxID=44930 RepID=L0AFJ3_NATGS|nr:DEAD/DEAH box helicase [Natronobacterium gregoryi]AFZ72586.1 superfamily II helicase [Natronobacterium gregoryi SP2]ELY71895.1 DEAD/DEAH box helicase domain-containing protein [Natronobacterium gregoryi SP2]PLK19333.1 DEAD/DEAH box helicase [Natronobacterium gregoryi SP2]SFJ52558.1 Replicative superfamily II helicase [Natronobacterium gregoryi]